MAIQASGGGTLMRGEMRRTRLWRENDRPERPEAKRTPFLRYIVIVDRLPRNLTPPSPFLVRRERNDTPQYPVHDEEERQRDSSCSETGCLDKSKRWRQPTSGLASVARTPFEKHSRQVLTVHQTVLVAGRFAGGFRF